MAWSNVSPEAAALLSHTTKLHILEETLSDLIVQSSADDQQDDTGKIINEAYGCSQVVGED
ncbi:unnamed protein product [Prunus armeniaca]|uniref:Uncharacterized protein n=1 Tax=Prunus armeniaca TaxID=36596 RepID=A0A6J5WTJ5_PRUAR|nr:unnamed protein product [Prunus armeniaca]